MLTLPRSVSLAAVLCLAASAPAYAWPEGPVTFVVPFGAGGGIDIVARVVAEKLSKTTGQPIIVENKPGAGAVIGTQVVVKAKPDGHALLFANNNLTVNPALVNNLPYDTWKALKPVIMVTKHPLVLLANPKLGVSSVKELIELSKKKPGGLFYASAGNGTPHHLEMEIFKQATGANIQHVPYQGSTPAVTDLIGGTVDIMFNGISPTLQYIRSGRLKAIGVDTNERAAVLPDVPSLTEAGLPEFKTVGWATVFAPHGTSPETVKAVADAIDRVLADPETRSKLESFGTQPSGLRGQSLAEHLQQEQAIWGEVIKRAGIQAQ